MKDDHTDKLTSIEDIIEGLGEVSCIAPWQIATAILIARNLETPVLVEGAGRMEVRQAVLYTQVLKDKIGDVLQDADNLDAAMGRLHGFTDVFFPKQFLEPRPLLKALPALLPRGQNLPHNQASGACG